MATEELKMDTLEDLKRQVESLGFEKKQKKKLIMEECRRMREAEAEERRLTAYAEKRRIAAEAEEQTLAAQAEE